MHRQAAEEAPNMFREADPLGTDEEEELESSGVPAHQPSPEAIDSGASDVVEHEGLLHAPQCTIHLLHHNSFSPHYIYILTRCVKNTI